MNTSTIVKTLVTFAARLDSLGETQGANWLNNRAKEISCPVELLYSDKVITVKTPPIANRKRFYAMLHQFKGIKSRKWDMKNSVNTFDKRDEKKVRTILQSFFAGHTLVSAQGTEGL